MTTLPAGTVTFLFTDIEGSTRLLHVLGGEDYAQVLADHRRLLREAFTDAGGREVDTQGDAFFVAFARARDAVVAAVAAQRAVLRHPWSQEVELRVRMGLHTGEPVRSDEGYVGIDVHRAARIAATAWGGQILISQATRELISGDLPDGVHLRYLGEHRLKDLTAPQRLYQITADGLLDGFPEPRSLNALPNNLPVQLTTLVGRDKELAEIERLLESPDCRMLTLIGPGGVGKTRLALHAAARRIERHAEGVFFVPLAAVGAPEFVVPTLAATLQFPIDTNVSDKDPKTQLLDFLGGRSMLLVMDNFEHLVDAAPLLDEVLLRATEIKLIVTSRERLNLRGEWTFDVPGLTYPRNGNGGRLEDYGAVSLFVERARQVDPGFPVTDENRRQVTRICRLVEGMPLGIELAAAWTPTLSCREIAEEIERNTDFLATSMRGVPDRHRSLRAAFEQSWRLLSDPQRAGLARLSVFRGGFSREAAAAVAGLDLPTLAELVNKSLVRRTVLGRYEIHELLQQYAAEKLGALAEEQVAVRARHSGYFAKWLAARSEAVRGPEMKEVRDEIRVESGNVGAAVLWQAVHGEERELRETLRALNSFYGVQGWHEGVDAFRRIVETLQRTREPETDPGGTSAGRRLASVQAYLAFWTSATGDATESGRIVEQCLPVLRRLGFQREVAACLTVLGVNASNEGDFAGSVKFLEEGAAIPEAAPDFSQWLDIWLGWDHFELGNYTEAERHYQAACDRASTRGDRLGLAFALSKWAMVADALKDYERGMRMHQDALDIFVDLENEGGQAYCLTRLSFTAWGLGRYEEAARLGRAGYEAFGSLGHPWGLIRSLCVIGFADLALGQMEQARASFTDALGRAMQHHQVSNALYALIGLASVMTREDDGVRAAEIFAFAIQHRFTPALFRDIARGELADLAQRVSADTLAAARTRGEASSLEQIVSPLRLGQVLSQS